jgi:hypothetical protein
VASENVLPLNRFLTFSRRRGWLPQIAAGAGLLLIVGGFALNSYLASRYGPDGTAVSFIEAAGSGDAATAWSLISIAGVSPTAGTADLATEQGLASQLHLAPVPTGATKVVVTAHRDVPGGVQVTVSYQLNNQRSSARLNLVQDPAAKHFGIYPSWRVVLVPSVIAIKSPGVPYAVDAHQLPATTLSVRILPGGHVLTTGQTDLFDPYTSPVEVEGGATASVSLEPNLTAYAAKGVSGAITQAFQACIANPYSGSCPAAFLQFTGQWQLIGDPGADVAAAVDSQGKPTASGHFLATVQQSFGEGRVDKAVGGGYSAVLSQSGSAFKVESLSGSTSAPALTRPAATSDSAVLQAVQTALTACIGSTQATPDNCPQGLSVGLGSATTSVRWSWDSDPMAGAKVVFDDQTGILAVTGPYAASATYVQSLLGTSSSRTSHSSGTYEAQVIYDSGSLRTVTING